MKMLEEFKSFAIKGNVVDMGVGIVIGAAFTSIVNSFVNDVLMPPIGIITGGVDFSDKVIVLRQATESAQEVVLSYGLFINAIISFVIVAFAIFLVVKQINKLKKKEEEKPSQTPADIQLLTEIRDSLRNR